MTLQDLNTDDRRKLAIVLKSRFSFDYVAESTDIRSYKQLKFFLANPSKLTPNQQKAVQHYKTAFSQSKYKTIIENIKSDRELTSEQQSIVDKLLPDLDKLKLKTPVKNYVLDKNDPLAKIISYYEDVLRRAENGEEFQWNKPWEDQIVFGIPHNLEGREYSGSNINSLAKFQQSQGLSVPVWLTKNQALELGLNVDELSIPPSADVIYAIRAYKHKTDRRAGLIFEKDVQELSKDEQNYYQKTMIRTSHPVWHPDHIEPYLSEDAIQVMKSKSTYFELYEKLKDKDFAERYYDQQAENVIQLLHEFAESEGIEIQEHKSRCYFDGHNIAIISRDAFNDDIAYAGTLAHELIHSTGVQHRLDRNSYASYHRSDHNRGFEEIVAETGSNNLLLRYNLQSALDAESAAYIVSWFKALKGSKQKKYGLFEGAAKQGNDAAEYISSGISFIQQDYRLEQHPTPENDVSFEVVVDLLKQVQAWRNYIVSGDLDDADIVRARVEDKYNTLQRDYCLRQHPTPDDGQVLDELTEMLHKEFDAAKPIEEQLKLSDHQKISTVKKRRMKL